MDFSGEVLQATRVADGAIITVGAKAGVQVGTEFAWKYATKRNIPKIIFVGKMDEDNANYNKHFRQEYRICLVNASQKKKTVPSGFIWPAFSSA